MFYVLLILCWEDLLIFNFQWSIVYWRRLLFGLRKFVCFCRKCAHVAKKCMKSADFCVVLGGFEKVRKRAFFFAFFCKTEIFCM